MIENDKIYAVLLVDTNAAGSSHYGCNQLERALIFLFILVGEPAGLGFLVAAKSIFRFGELKETAQRMQAEYIMIGTLWSFAYGIAVSYGTYQLFLRVGS